MAQRARQVSRAGGIYGILRQPIGETIFLEIKCVHFFILNKIGKTIFRLVAPAKPMVTPKLLHKSAFMK